MSHGGQVARYEDHVPSMQRKDELVGEWTPSDAQPNLTPRMIGKASIAVEAGSMPAMRRLCMLRVVAANHARRAEVV